MDVSKYSEEFYSKVFDENYLIFHSDRVKKLKKILSKYRGKALDLGCGNGLITRNVFGKNRNDLFGVDLSKKNVSYAKSLGIKAKLCDLDKQKLPFKKKFFDVLLASEILEHVYDTELLVKEMNDVLKKNGVLVITVPNLGAWYNRILLFFGRLPAWIESGSKKGHGNLVSVSYGHVKAFTKSSLKELLNENGFNLIKVSGSGIDLKSILNKTNYNTLDDKQCKIKFLGKDFNLKKNAFGKMKFKWFIAFILFHYLEKLFSKFSGLSTCLIVEAKKK